MDFGYFGFRKSLNLEALHAIYEAPRYILLHRQNSRLGIFTASVFSKGGGFRSCATGNNRVESENPHPCKKPQGWGTRDHQQIQHLKLSTPCRNLSRTRSAF